jgi:hypothetical protein
MMFFFLMVFSLWYTWYKDVLPSIFFLFSWNDVWQCQRLEKGVGGINVFCYSFVFQTFSSHVYKTHSFLWKMMVMLRLGFELIDIFCCDEIWLWMAFFLVPPALSYMHCLSFMKYMWWFVILIVFTVMLLFWL